MVVEGLSDSLSEIFEDAVFTSPKWQLMSARGQSHHFDRGPAPSGLPRSDRPGMSGWCHGSGLGEPPGSTPPTPTYTAVREVTLTRFDQKFDSCWLGVGVHAPPRAIRCLPVPPAGLHPSAPMRSPVSTGYSAACRFRGSCPTCLSSRLGLQPSFPVRPICCLRLSAWSASLALPTTWPTMPSADFCPAVRPPYGALNRRSDTEQISWGEFSRLPCIVAGSTLRILDGYGLRGTWPARPTLAPSTEFCPSTRTFAVRFLQTSPRGDSPCVVANPSPPSGWVEDFHLQAS